MQIKADSVLYTQCALGQKRAPNRLVAQPMESNEGGPSGQVSDRTLERYKNLARGKWGVVFVEAVSISESSIAQQNGLAISRKNLDGFKRLVQAFKEINPDSLFLFQVTHSGRKSGPFSQKTSICPDPPEGAHYLSTDEIEAIREAFVAGVLLADKAGADGVDFKVGHGYFGTEMLRPANVRSDKWGGSLENRTRFLADSIKEIKGSLKSQHFILGSRVSMYEAIRGGCGTAAPDEQIEDLTEMKEIIRLMDRLGMDYVNVSAGLPGVTSEITIPTKPYPHAFLSHFRYAKLVKEMNTSLKVIGSAYSVIGAAAPMHAEENLRKGYTDFAGFGRQTFADPLYPTKLGRGEKIDYCVACSRCGRLIENQRHTGCVIYNDYYRKLDSKLRRDQ